jgi:hypothetical protein
LETKELAAGGGDLGGEGGYGGDPKISTIALLLQLQEPKMDTDRNKI